MSWLPKRSVVVPVDFSDDSIEAVRLARTMVDDVAALHVIHVLPALAPTEPGVIWHTVDDGSRTEHATEAIAERLVGVECEGVDVRVVFGDPGSEIAEFAKETEAELIVLPSHGRTGLKRLLIGSVAERVVRLAHCPVLVLRK